MKYLRKEEEVLPRVQVKKGGRKGGGYGQVYSFGGRYSGIIYGGAAALTVIPKTFLFAALLMHIPVLVNSKLLVFSLNIQDQGFVGNF